MAVNFNILLATPQVSPLVQENLLERVIHDSLFPKLLFRNGVTRETWQANTGEVKVFTADGLLKPSLQPARPGMDPTPKTYQSEQWSATLQQWNDTQDEYVPNSFVAIADMFVRKCQRAGMQAGQVINRLIRNNLYNASESGWTVADGAQGPTTTLRVKRLNGFTRARSQVAGASQVRFEPVSTTNPLQVQVFDTAGPAYVTRNVTAVTPDTVGDETGPGVLTLSSNVTVLDRAAVKAVDRTFIVRAGGGDKVDDVGSSDLPTFAGVRDMVARFREMNVPEMASGSYDCHCDPTSESFLFRDTEFQSLMRGATMESEPYRKFVITNVLGVTFFRNNECPLPTTVEGGLSATWSAEDPFAGELYNNGATTGVRLHRMLFQGAESIFEFYADLSQLITEAGVQGRVSNTIATPAGIETHAEGVQFIIRSPQGRLQDTVSISWKFMGCWTMRTDACTGDAARYKRTGILMHGE